MNSPFIDERVLRDLQATAGAAFVAELVDTFLEEAPTLLATLRAAYARHDAEAFRRAAHSLKSNSQTFGAAALGAMARTLELGGVGLADLPALAALQSCYASAAEELRERSRV